MTPKKVSRKNSFEEKNRQTQAKLFQKPKKSGKLKEKIRKLKVESSKSAEDGSQAGGVKRKSSKSRARLAEQPKKSGKPKNKNGKKRILAKRAKSIDQSSVKHNIEPVNEKCRNTASIFQKPKNNVKAK
eukprot:TRINITY_DN982_c0_g1_i1.p1 TRINITY_DN982_c0_g1~~TRINITY_DN982_c0_g1_i1.p1  ORF type:complete len:145 (+),score=27.72 TRINITY_DN982_c0_g1_i1:49-435(+)